MSRFDILLAVICTKMAADLYELVMEIREDDMLKIIMPRKYIRQQCRNRLSRRIDRDNDVVYNKSI